MLTYRRYLSVFVSYFVGFAAAAAAAIDFYFSNRRNRIYYLEHISPCLGNKYLNRLFTYLSIKRKLSSGINIL